MSDRLEGRDPGARVYCLRVQGEVVCMFFFLFRLVGVPVAGKLTFELHAT